MACVLYVESEVHRGDTDWAQWARLRGAEKESNKRQCAAYNLGRSLYGDSELEGKNGEAERVFREVHGIRMRVLGAEHPETLTSAAEMASCLSREGNLNMPRQSRSARVRPISPAPSWAEESMLRRSRSAERCLPYESACWDRSIRTRSRVRPISRRLPLSPMITCRCSADQSRGARYSVAGTGASGHTEQRAELTNEVRVCLVAGLSVAL
jgi:hypothetical protein